MARIGIYGGTFNPVHKTHIEIGKIAFSQLNLDRLIFLISGEPPHKDSAENVLTFQRLEMLQLALADEENFEIDTREIYRSGKSYSYLTLQEYKVEFPDDELYFIMGSDSILQFQNWVNPNIITELATVAVVLRAGDDIDEVKECLTNLENLYNKEFILLDFKPNDFASSTVRKNLDDNQVLNNQLSTNVIEYIKEHNPYGKVYSMDCISEIDSKVKKVLKTSRYTHTLGVANICYALAIKWAYPANNAYIAGLLHDCAKCISDSERLSVCKKNDITITPIEKKYPHLLHGKVGAFYCTHKYGIDDNQIAHAISIHTTGCPNMNLLDKILFVADYIEPNRNKQPRLDVLRRVAFENLDKCVYMILEDTVNYLNTNPEETDPTTIETFEFYKNIMR